MKTKIKSFLLAYFILLFVACGGAPKDEVTLSYLALTVENTSLDYQETAQLDVYAVNSDNSAKTLADEVTFTSSDPNVLTVSNNGLITAVSEGQSTISASYNGKKSSQTIAVSYLIIGSNIQLTPDSDSLIEGTNYQLELWVEKSDSQLYQMTDGVLWSSNNQALAQVSDTGLLSLITQGEVIIEASYGDIATQHSINIKEKTITGITIDLSMNQVPLGYEAHAVVNALYNNGSSDNVTAKTKLTPSDESVAVINNEGVISSINVGATTLSAEFAGLNANVNIEVTDAVVEKLLFNLTNNSVPVGMVVDYIIQQQFSDGKLIDITKNQSVTLVSDNSTIASVDDFVITTNNPGSSNITVTAGDFYASALLSVSEEVVTKIALSADNPTLPLGLSTLISSNAILSTGSKILINPTYISSDETVLTVNQEGIISPLGIGQAIITGMYNNFENSVAIEVTAAALSSLNVSFDNTSIPTGHKAQAIAIGTYTDGTNSDVTSDVTWRSGVPSLVTVSNVVKGEISALIDSNIDISNPVTVQITASSNGVTNSAGITVVSAVVSDLAISAPSNTAALGNTLQMSATATYSNLNDLDVSHNASWSSNDESIATISSNGLLTTIAEGSITVSAEFGGFNENFIVTIGPAILDFMTIQANKAFIYKRRTVQVNAIATMSDGSEITRNNFGTWTIDQANIATISNSPEKQGEVTSISDGNVIITFIPDDTSLPAVTTALIIKPISQMADEFHQSGSSFISVADGMVQQDSLLTLVITNNTGETLNLLKFSVSDANGLKTSTSDPNLLRNGVLNNGEDVSIAYVVGSEGATQPITLVYILEDPLTGESFYVARLF